MTDRLPELAARLEQLNEVAVAEHPDVLEAVQAELVAELDALTGAARAADAPTAHARMGGPAAAPGGVERAS